MTSPMYARSEIIKRFIYLRQVANEILKLEKRRYKRNCYRRVRFASIFCASDYVLLDGPPLLPPTAEPWISERFDTIFPCKERTYRMTCENRNTVCIMQDVVNNKISIHQATLGPTSTHHCNGKPTNEVEWPSKEEVQLDTKFNEYQGRNDKTYVFDNIVPHAGSGICCHGTGTVKRQCHRASPLNTPIFYRRILVMICTRRKKKAPIGVSWGNVIAHNSYTFPINGGNELF